MEFDFTCPDYNSVAIERFQRIEKLQRSKETFDVACDYYRENIDVFIDHFGYTLDPRNNEINRPSLVPFRLFPRQREFVQWIFQKWKKRQDGICVKSRDMGVSWLCAAVAACFILFYDNFIFGFGSRKEEYVDSQTPKSLFWKIREFLRYLPPEFLPEKLVCTHMRIENKDRNSWITGEAGENIGRGDRASIYALDEAAFIEHQSKVDAALSQTSNCKIWVSTINEPGDAFHQKQIGGAFDIFEFDWRDDPRKNQRWYDAQKKKYAHDPILLAREIDRDYSASTGDSWIPTSLVEAAQRIGPRDIQQNIYDVKCIIGVDAAHMGDDESVISARAGRVAFPQVCGQKWDGHRLAEEVMEYCRHSSAHVYAIVIELDGPGISCYDTLMKHKLYAELTYGVHTAGGGDNNSYNLRAKMYRRAKEWLDSPPCSVPADIHFRVQLSSVKYSYRDGKLLLMSKKEMKAKGLKSPDKADAFALTFAVNEDTLVLPESDARYFHDYHNRRERSQITGY